MDRRAPPRDAARASDHGAGPRARAARPPVHGVRSGFAGRGREVLGRREGPGRFPDRRGRSLFGGARPALGRPEASLCRLHRVARGGALRSHAPHARRDLGRRRSLRPVPHGGWTGLLGRVHERAGARAQPDGREGGVTRGLWPLSRSDSRADRGDRRANHPAQRHLRPTTAAPLGTRARHAARRRRPPDDAQPRTGRMSGARRCARARGVCERRERRAVRSPPVREAAHGPRERHGDPLAPIRKSGPAGAPAVDRGPEHDHAAHPGARGGRLLAPRLRSCLGNRGPPARPAPEAPKAPSPLPAAPAGPPGAMRQTRVFGGLRPLSEPPHAKSLPKAALHPNLWATSRSMPLGVPESRIGPGPSRHPPVMEVSCRSRSSGCPPRS